MILSLTSNAPGATKLTLVNDGATTGYDLLAGASFTAIVGTLGANYVWAIGHTDQTSPDMELPLWLVYLCIPCGSYLMCFRFLQVAWTFFRTGELPKHDVAHVEGIDGATAVFAVPDLHPADKGKPA